MPFVHSLAHPGRRSLSLVALLTTLAVLALVASADARPKRGPNAVADTTATAPETTISSGPSGTITVSSASFGFSSSESGSSFQCQLDSAAYAACSSPKAYSARSDGAHTFSVRATDAAGNTDPSPATRSFAVDTTTGTTPPPSGAIPSDWRRFASFESSLNADSDYGWRADSPFDLTRTSEVGGSDGDYAAKIVTNGGSSGCSCPRMTFDNLSYGPGDEVWIGGAWRVSDPSKLAWSRLMNLGHYEGVAGKDWYLALESTSAGTFQVGYAAYGGSHVAVLPARPIPADRWFRVDLHFKLSPTNGQALTEWYIDGQLVGTTTKANMFNGDPLHFYNAGLPYFWPGNGSTTVYFDAPRLAP